MNAVLLNMVKITHEESSAETTFKVFHSLNKESTNISHECLKRLSAGVIFDGGLGSWFVED
jgi:hypothetical protein